MLNSRRLSRLLNTLLAVLLLSSSTLLHARLYDDVIDSGYIRIGFYKDFPPYSFMDNGEPAGIDVEIGKRIAEYLGVRFEPHWITPDENLEDDLRNNVWKGHYLDKDPDDPFAVKRLADVMMRVPYDREYSYMRDSTGYIINDMVVMFGPYQRETWQIVFNKERIDQVTTIAKFQYHTIGVEIDSLPHFYLTSAFNGRLREKTHQFMKVEEAYSALHNEEVSAVMSMRAEADFWLEQLDDSRLVYGENAFPMIGKQVWDIGMAIRQTDRQLGHEVAYAVETLIQTGEMEKIFASLGLRYELPGFYQDVQ